MCCVPYVCRFKDDKGKKTYLEQIGHMCRNGQHTLYLDFKHVINFEATGRAGIFICIYFSFILSIYVKKKGKKKL